MISTGCHSDRSGKFIARAPAGERYTGIDTTGVTVIPNGRLVTPVGQSYRIAPHPFGLTLSQDGSIAVTANSGVRPLSVSILQGIGTDSVRITQIPPGPVTDKGVLASVFMGLSVSPQNDTLYVAGGQENKVYMFGISTGESLGFINCAYKNDSVDYSDGYIGDMTITHDGNFIYAVDQINFRMVILDTRTQQLIRNVPVGRYPFGITLSPDEKTAWVANVGMYVYKPIEGIDPDNLQETAPAFPPFAYGTPEAEKGIKTDTLVVPGLGKSNVPESFSVWSVDISQPDDARVVSKIKTGVLVGEMVEDFPAVGGSSPNSVAATPAYVFVSNGNNDNISVIGVREDTVVHTIHLDLDPRIDHLRGKIPFGLDVSPDYKRLYVAESGINAVAVIDIPSFRVVGHIPAGWFPSKVCVTPDGKKLVVANAKGYGSGPNGGKNFDPGNIGSYIGFLMRGTVTVMDIPSDRELKEYTRKVIANNFSFTRIDDPGFARRKENPIPLYPGEHREDSLSPVKYLVFVTKENRTFDEIFGQIAGADGDSSLARYGEGVTFSNRKHTDTVRDAVVMPNHLALARHFAIGDNYYVDSDVSADGHRWLANTYPNEWVETCAPASYGGNRNFKEGSPSPGYLAFTGAAGAIYPEDYNEAGSLWDQLDRYDIPFYNFGEGVMFEPASYERSYKYTGMRYLFNYPLPAPLFENTSHTYPTFNMGIPDQFRIDMFIKEVNEKWLKPGNPLPPLLTIILPNDHGAGERPEDGYPYRESYMADNDLALGRMVEFLSHTPYWKNMAIIVTEDDAQNGVDHIDAHRSVLMVISPWAKKNYVGHVHYSFGSIFKTIWNVLGVPYLNEYDATATDLANMFTSVPDFTPYNALPVDKRIFDPVVALTPLDENFNWQAVEESPEIDNVKDMIRDNKENEADRMKFRESEKIKK
ncbi:MAG: bifunctional YncE family protein/alkaline phosphatase family protein [Chlorobi bacterium]|nr:bifunctional YncE family protein/alkaline phosphatase family protein [Chlorobiota bacterium]